jgi:AcrR family transcriptional regulator
VPSPSRRRPTASSGSTPHAWGAPPGAATRGRTGRRPGESGTREAIAAAAARPFAENGYDRTSLRSIALEAGVDPALVARFYGTKQQLFTTVVRFPFDPERVVALVLGGDRATIGERLAGFVVGVLGSPQGAATVTGIVRSAASEPEAARLVRERIGHDVLAPLAAGLGSDHPEVRAALVGSQLVGLVMARQVVGLPALTALEPAALVRLIAPTLQRYLVEPIDGLD